jgi:hypothetical protein
LAQLHDLLQLIQAQEARGAIASEVSKLQWFGRYFQTSAISKASGEPLCTTLQATTGLDEEAHEYEKRTRLNHLLALTGELQARGVLAP